jgi:hypothetical protein
MLRHDGPSLPGVGYPGRSTGHQGECLNLLDWDTARVNEAIGAGDLAHPTLRQPPRHPDQLGDGPPPRDRLFATAPVLERNSDS